MKYLKTGFTHIDKSVGGLKQGEVYFISASCREITRGFAASLCTSINNFDAYKAIFYTDSPIPYCRSEHIHFVNVNEVIEFLRVDLIADKAHGLPNTGIYIFEDFDLLSTASFNTWPCDKYLRKHLYEANLYTIKNLAREFQATIILMDQLYESNSGSDDLSCDFPDIRYKLSEGSFHLSERGNGVITVQYINHHNLDIISFCLKSEPKEITQVYPAYSE